MSNPIALFLFELDDIEEIRFTIDNESMIAKIEIKHRIAKPRSIQKANWVREISLAEHMSDSEVDAFAQWLYDNQFYSEEHYIARHHLSNGSFQRAVYVYRNARDL